MRKGVDYSVPAKDWNLFGTTLKKQGFDFVGRYLSAKLKGIRQQEAEALRSLGIEIFFYYETTTGRALKGQTVGEKDADKASKILKDFVGAPATLPIILAVDMDADPTKVLPYFKGANNVLGVERTGAYGGYKVIKRLFDENLISYAVQTEAWSYLNGKPPRHPPVWDPRAQVHQWTCHRAACGDKAPCDVCGVSCDVLEAVSPEFGQWKLGA